MTDRLHGLLHASVPAPPATPERASLVRARVRRGRRRTTVALVVAAAAVVASVAAVPALLGDGHDRDAVAPPTPASPPAPRTTDVRCPSITEPTHGPSSVLEGAVAVRLCQGTGMTFDAPEDLLVTDVSRLTATINRQPTGPAPTGCNLDLGRGYQLVFTYPDGHAQSVAGELYGCHALTVGGTFRGDPETPFDTFVRLLRAQRADQGVPTGAARRPGCPRHGSIDLSPVARPEEMVVATLCLRFPTAPERPTTAVPVSARDLAVLLSDRSPRPSEATAGGDAAQLDLVGATAWGDAVMLQTHGDWWPGPLARRVLERLAAGALPTTPAVDASSTPAEVVAAYVDLLGPSGDRDAAAALWMPQVGPPDLPAGPIEVKVERVRPQPLVSAWRDATEVVALYRFLPEDEPAPDYRTAHLLLGRDEHGVFRIVHLQLGAEVGTGR